MSWEIQYDENGDIYYLNQGTGEVSWEVPDDYNDPSWQSAPDPTPTSWEEDTTAGSAELPITAEAFEQTGDQTAVLTSAADTGTHVKFTTASLNQEASANAAEIAAEIAAKDRRKWQYRRRWRKAYLHVTYKRYTELVKEYDDDAVFLNSELQPSTPGKPNKTPKRRQRPRTSNAPSTPGASSGTSSVAMSAADSSVATAASAAVADPSVSLDAVEKACARMGRLKYEEGEFAAASEWLTRACTLQPSNVRLLRECGMSFLRRFEEDGQHAHLNRSRDSLFRALMLRGSWVEDFVHLPAALMEMANLYELCGAFEGALEIMGKVTEFFPKFNKYSQVLHRSALVMMHISRFPGAAVGALLTRSIEFLDDLFEEKPVGDKLRPLGGRHALAAREDVLLLYARATASLADVCSSDVSQAAAMAVTEQKSDAAFGEAFSLRKGFEDADTLGHASWESWWVEPGTHQALANECLDAGEPTVAAYHFEEMARLRKVQGRAGPEAGTASALADFHVSLSAAHCFFGFQDVAKGLRWTERAYLLRLFDSGVRALLSRWSASYAALFRSQEQAAMGVQHHWKKRAWSVGHYKLFREAQVSEWEHSLQSGVPSQYWDPLTRAKLAYFRRSKWRGLFLFEDATAKRLQRWARNVKAMAGYHAALKEAHLKRLASSLQALRRKPYHLETREQCVQLSSHRRTPQHHKIKQCGFAFQQEHSSATKLQRQYLGLRARRRVHLLRSELASLALKRREGAALAIQCCVRCRWARGLVGVQRAEREELEDFAVKLQRLWTRKRGLWALGEQLKTQAHLDKVRAATLKVALWLQATHRRHVAATLVNLTWPHACGALQRVWRGYCWRLHRFRHFEANARVVQRAWRQRVERHRWLALLRRLRSDHARKGSSSGQALANPLSGWVTARLQQRRRWGRPDLATAHEGVPTPTPPPLQQLPPPILAPRHCLLSPSFPMNGEEEGEEEDGWAGGRCSWGEQLLPWLRLKVQTRLTSNDEHQESDAQEGEEEVWALPPPLCGPYCPVGLPGSPAWPHSIRLTTLIFASEGYCSELAAGRELGEQDGKGGALFDFPQTGSSSSSSFGTVDSLMLASLLRHQNCHLRTLVLIGADLSDPDSSRDLAAAVGDSKTLRKVVLAGCGMPRNTLTTLALTARAHNFNLKELIVDANPTEGYDDTDESGVAEGEGGGEIGRAFQGLLVADFFATQYGRLETLSLCGLGLTDSDAVLLARGLAHSVGPSGTAGWRLNLKKKKNSGLAVALNDGGAASSSSSSTATTGGLRRLSLADNAICDGGVLALAGALKERDAAHARQEVDADKEQRASEKALEEYLERTGGAVVGGGGPAVARPVVVRLWELDLSGNRVTEQGAKELLTYMLAANSPPPPPPQQQQQQQQQGEPQKQTRRRSRQERYDEEYPGIVHTDENGMAAGMATMQRWNSDASASTATSVSTGIISSGSSTSSSSSSSHRRFSLKQQTLATSPSVVDAGGGGNSLPQEQPPSPREQKTSYKPCSLRRLNLARNLIKDGVGALACQVLRGAPWLLEVDLRLNMFRPHAEERLNQVVEENAAAKRRLAKGASREEGCAAASSTINDEASASSSSFSSGVGNADGDDGTEVRQQRRRRRPRDGKGFGDGADYCGNSSRMQDQRTTTAAAPTSPAAAASISGLVGGSQKEGNDCAWLFRPRLMQGFAPPPHSAHTAAAAQARSAVPLLASDIQPVDIFRGAYSLDQPPTTVLSDSGVEVGGVKTQQRQPQQQQQQWRNLPLPSPDKYALTDVARVAQRLTLTHTPQQHQQQQHASASSMFAPSPTPKQQRGQRRRRTDASVSSPSFGGRTWLAAAAGKGGGGRRDEGGALSSSPASAEELLRLRYGLAQSASAKTRGGGQCTRRTTASSTPSTLFGSKHVSPVEHYQQQQQQKYENDDDDADSAVTFLSLSVAGGGVGIQSVPNTSSSSSTSSLVAKESDRRRRVLSDPHHDQRHLGDHRDDDDDDGDDGSATVHSVTDPLSSSLLRLVSGHVSSPSSSSRQRGRRHGSGSNGHKVGSPGRREETESSSGGDIFETTKGEGRRKEAAPPRTRLGLSGML